MNEEAVWNVKITVSVSTIFIITWYIKNICKYLLIYIVIKCTMQKYHTI